MHVNLPCARVRTVLRRKFSLVWQSSRPGKGITQRGPGPRDRQTSPLTGRRTARLVSAARPGRGGTNKTSSNWMVTRYNIDLCSVLVENWIPRKDGVICGTDPTRSSSSSSTVDSPWSCATPCTQLFIRARGE